MFIYPITPFFFQVKSVYVHNHVLDEWIPNMMNITQELYLKQRKLDQEKMNDIICHFCRELWKMMNEDNSEFDLNTYINIF